MLKCSAKYCFWALLPVGLCIDAYRTIGSYVSCVSTHLLHTCNCLQVKKMSVMYKSAHVAIALQLLEMSSITTPNQTI